MQPNVLVPLASLLLAFGGLPAQDPTPDARLATAHAAWQQKWQAFTEAALAARQGGEVKKGGMLPEPVQQRERDANAARDEILGEFGRRDDLAAASYLLLARLHETARDYRSAVDAYARCLAKRPGTDPDFDTLGAICIAAMNSKDDALAATWMRTLLASEARHPRPGRRNQQVATSYFPRTLIALGAWDELDEHLRKLADDPAPACKAAAVTFGVVAKLHRGDVDGARAAVAALRADPLRYPGHQAWAVLAELALRVHAGEFDEGAALVRDFLAQQAPDKPTPVEQNQRRYLAAVAPFLGKPAPALAADHCVGGDLTGDDVLPGLRGKVVVLDFWQPWCEPCRKAMPEMVAAASRYGEQVAVLGVCKVEDYGYDVSERKAVRPIAPEEYPAHVADFRADMELNYPLLIEGTGRNNKAYAVAGVPTLVIVDRQGIVRYMSCGAGEPGLFQLALEGVVARQ